MSSSRKDNTAARAVEVIAQFVSNNDLDELRASYARGEITQDELVNEIAARYQRGIGSAVQAVAEHDKALAVQIGERLRDRIEEQLTMLSNRGSLASRREPKRAGPEALKDRDDDVLIREYLILRALTKGNASPFRTAEILALVHQFEPGAQENSVTAHLTRMFNAGLLEKASKGRYNAVPASKAHMAALADAIEQRGLQLPAQPE